MVSRVWPRCLFNDVSHFSTPDAEMGVNMSLMCVQVCLWHRLAPKRMIFLLILI